MMNYHIHILVVAIFPSYASAGFFRSSHCGYSSCMNGRNILVTVEVKVPLLKWLREVTDKTPTP
jgi:hypothetical protein